jgi:hypothetical protein
VITGWQGSQGCENREAVDLRWRMLCITVGVSRCECGCQCRCNVELASAPAVSWLQSMPVPFFSSDILKRTCPPAQARFPWSGR